MNQSYYFLIVIVLILSFLWKLKDKVYHSTANQKIKELQEVIQIG